MICSFLDVSGFGHAFGAQSAWRFERAAAVSTARSRGGYGRATSAAVSWIFIGEETRHEDHICLV